MRTIAEQPLASRRQMLFATAGGLALVAGAVRAADQVPTETNSKGLEPPMKSPVAYVEHRVKHDGHDIYVQDYPGKGPAYVLIHGFPDNLHIFDYIVPYLTQAGRRVVAFDFLGFGKSEKVATPGFQYTFKQQVGDLEAIADALKLDKFIPVGHDSGGPIAINYALDHTSRIAWLCVMNCFYGKSPTFRLPEIIEVFGNPSLRDLAKEFLAAPEKMAWLLRFQDIHFQAKMPDWQKARFDGILKPIVDSNFADGAGPAFAQMTSQVYDSVAYNTTRIPDARKFKPKVRFIWGSYDPYLTPDAARAIGGLFPNNTVNLVDTGHWLMIDSPEQVAKLMLAEA